VVSTQRWLVIQRERESKRERERDKLIDNQIDD